MSLSELNVGANDLEEIPPSIGLLRHLRTVYADENFIVEIPPEVSALLSYSVCVSVQCTAKLLIQSHK